VYVPVGGSIALPFTDDVARSYFNGVIRGFLGGAQGKYGVTTGINATGNHPTHLTAAFSELYAKGQKSVVSEALVMTPPDNATQIIYWVAPVALTITAIKVSIATVTTVAGTLVTTATKTTGTVNMLGAANYDIASNTAPKIAANTWVSIPLSAVANATSLVAGGTMGIQVVSNNAGMVSAGWFWQITYTID